MLIAPLYTGVTVDISKADADPVTHYMQDILDISIRLFSSSHAQPFKKIIDRLVTVETCLSLDKLVFQLHSTYYAAHKDIINLEHFDKKPVNHIFQFFYNGSLPSSIKDLSDLYEFADYWEMAYLLSEIRLKLNDLNPELLEVEEAKLLLNLGLFSRETEFLLEKVYEWWEFYTPVSHLFEDILNTFPEKMRIKQEEEKLDLVPLSSSRRLQIENRLLNMRFDLDYLNHTKQSALNFFKDKTHHKPSKLLPLSFNAVVTHSLIENDDTISLNVDGVIFPTYFPLLLLYAPTFARYIKDKRGAENKVSLDPSWKEVFPDFLNYLYVGKISSPDNHPILGWLKLREIAKKFFLNTLVQLVEDQITKCLSGDQDNEYHLWTLLKLDKKDRKSDWDTFINLYLLQNKDFEARLNIVLNIRNLCTISPAEVSHMNINPEKKI